MDPILLNEENNNTIFKIDQQENWEINNSEIIFTDSVLTDDHQKMEEILSYLASIEDLSVNDIGDIDSENYVESDEEEEDLVEDLVNV